jgi:ferredoxin
MAKIKIISNSGEIMTEFTADQTKSIGTAAIENGANIQIPCGMGACGMCAGKISKGEEFIDNAKFGENHLGIQILLCISGIKDNAPDDAEIEIQMENY